MRKDFALGCLEMPPQLTKNQIILKQLLALDSLQSLASELLSETLGLYDCSCVLSVFHFKENVGQEDSQLNLPLQGTSFFNAADPSEFTSM